jgi:CHAT domain-containing protein
LILGLGAAASAQPESKKPDEPPYRRVLTGEDAKRVERLEKQIEDLRRAGKFAEGCRPARAIVEIRRRMQGEAHWETQDARRLVELLEKIASLPAKAQSELAEAEKRAEEADTLYERGRYQEALPLQHRVLEIRRRHLGPAHLEVARTLNDLAISLSDSGKPTEAEPLFRQALAIRLKVLGEDHLHTAQSYVNEAANLAVQGKHAEAEPLFRLALAIHQKVLGEDHLDTAQSYHNVASILTSQDKHAEAEMLDRHALAIRMKVLGKEHPDTAQSYHSLAVDLLRVHKYAEAETMARQALAIRMKVLGKKHSETAQSYHNVASILTSLGKHAEAEMLDRQALAIRIEVLGKEHPDTAQSYHSLAIDLFRLHKYAEAETMDRQALAIRRQVLGEEHAETAQSYHSLAIDLFRLHKYAEAETIDRKALAIRRKVLGEEHPDTAQSYHSLAVDLSRVNKYAEAETMDRKALTIRRKVLGEEHPDTAQSYHSLGDVLNNRGTYAEADPFFRQALAIRRKILGEDHLGTAETYCDLAHNSRDRGAYAEAELLYRRALSIRQTALGDEHADTAECYRGVADCLAGQGRYAEAQPLYDRALAICRAVLGEEHSDTALSYNNLATNLSDRGMDAEAEPFYRKALAIRRRVLGEEDWITARSYENLAKNLSEQERYAEAESFYRKALGIRRKLLGEDHPETARSYSNLGTNLSDRGKPAEAEMMGRKALAIRQKVLGEDHPETANSYNNVAVDLDHQGRHAEAEQLHRRALAIHQKVLGEDHPFTVASHSNLADNLEAQGKYAEAAASWAQATQSFDVARLRSSTTGLERASFGGADSPWPALAACQARLGQPLLAWQSLEAGVARGLLDDLSTRLTPGPTLVERERQQGLKAALDRLDRQVTAWFQAKRHTDAEQAQFRELVRERQATQAELARLAAVQAARQVYDHKLIQKQLPADAAWIAWVDLDGQPNIADPIGEHWACVLRHQGDPIWVRLPGSGPRGAWTEEDDDLLDRFRQAVAGPPGQSREDYAALARQVAAQRLTRLQPPLRATDSLPAVKHLLVCPAWQMAGVPVEALTDQYTISYVPSGTLFARFKEERRAKGPAGRGATLFALGDPAFGKRPTSRPEPLTKTGRYYPRLPGTRQEVQAITGLFDQPLVLLGATASVQRLVSLAQKDELRRFRYLHFATHGAVNDRVALQSALILAPDPRPAGTGRTPADLPESDGQLTAAQMLHWKLDAELVTLSACQSGLGKQAGGEGFLGFAQALFLAGARSVLVSLWKVDDTATALLMTRFYQNLLGKRPGLKAPLPKAEALREAKLWLRDLTATEVQALQTELRAGRLGAGPAVKRQVEAEAERPYAHPHYWAAFILIGDPT